MPHPREPEAVASPGPRSSAELVELIAAGDTAAVLARLEEVGREQGAEAAARALTCREFGGRGAKSPLHSAAQQGRAEILGHLLRLRADPDALDDACSTPLHLAAGAGHARVAHLLLQARAEGRAANSFGRTAAQATEEQSWDAAHVRRGKALVRRMLAGHLEPYADLPQEPPVTLAAEGAAAPAASGRSAGSKGARDSSLPRARPPSAALRDCGGEEAWRQGRRASAPSVMSCPARSSALLSEVVKSGSVEAVCARLEELRAQGGDDAVRAEVSNCEDGDHDIRVAHSSLHVAVREGHCEILRALLATRASVNTINDQWNTPLHFAAESGRREAAEVLLQAGADPLIRNSFGRAAEELAFVTAFDTGDVALGKADIQKMLRKLAI